MRFVEDSTKLDKLKMAIKKLNDKEKKAFLNKLMDQLTSYYGYGDEENSTSESDDSGSSFSSNYSYTFDD